jgi:hypothetical protein
MGVVFWSFVGLVGFALFMSGADSGLLWQSTVSAAGGALALVSAVTLAHVWVMEVVLFSQRHLD